MANQSEVKALIDEYCDTRRHPDLLRFIAHEQQPWEGWWASQQSQKAGCYVIYSDQKEAMYDGKASLKATMGSRPAVHERSGHDKWNDAKFVQMIEVVEPFEAPSLEEFLLSRLSTRYNKVGAIKPDFDSQ